METSEGQFIGNDGVRIWLEKMDCLLEKIKHQHKSEHRYSTLATAAMDNWLVNFLKWKDSFCLEEI